MKRYFPSQLMSSLLATLAMAIAAATVQTTTAQTPAASGAAAGVAATANSSIVAVVNADPITADQLAEESVRRYGVDMLDNMINRHLILQACTAGNPRRTQKVRGQGQAMLFSLEAVL
jgi:hypothetical protein